jgi:hypothetical protein
MVRMSTLHSVQSNCEQEALMDFTGLLLYKISDKNDNLVDLRFDFLAGLGSKDLALYWFDNHSKSADQAIADAAVLARVQGKTPKMQIDIVGERPSGPLNKRMIEDFHQLASTKGDKVVAKFSKGGSGSFTVTVERKTNKTDLEVPFDGDPGKLAEKTFHGKLKLMAHSKEKDSDLKALIDGSLKIKP